MGRTAWNHICRTDTGGKKEGDSRWSQWQRTLRKTSMREMKFRDMPIKQKWDVKRTRCDFPWISRANLPRRFKGVFFCWRERAVVPFWHPPLQIDNKTVKLMVKTSAVMVWISFVLPPRNNCAFLISDIKNDHEMIHLELARRHVGPSSSGLFILCQR